VTVTILSGGAVLTGNADGRVFERGAVAFEGARIVAVGAETAIFPAYPEARRLDARGGLIVPGLINLHHHFYSAFARGLSPDVQTTDFEEVLRGLWWRLDRALDPAAVRVSAALALADCVRWGCTTVFDHHASPSCIPGSLDWIAGEVRKAGISAVLCYEVTDRNGREGAMAGLDENLRFLLSQADDARVRGMVGLHAAFTLTDETLARVGITLPRGAGIHVHAAEGTLDAGPLARLDRHGLLGPDALLAHGVHLTRNELELVAERGATLVHNPESNAHNGVGRLDLLAAAESGCRLGLGTDGMSSNVLRSLRAAFLGLRDARRDPSSGFDVIPGLLGGNAEFARRAFAEPLLGQLVPGAPADIAVFDAPSPTPVAAANAFGHLVYAASEAPVRHTIARGRVLMKDFELLSLDLESVAAEARRLAPGVWGRFREISA
jgi:putative selenium metabolism protein SsnA